MSGGDLAAVICTPCARDSPRRLITWAWYTSLVFVAIVFIVGCLFASRVSHANASISFAVVFSSLVGVFVSIAGTVILRRYWTPIMIGWLLGAVAVVAQQNLVLFAIFVEVAEEGLEEDKAITASRAAAAFLFFLFVIYALFASMLWAFRTKLLEEMAQGSQASRPRLEGGEYDDGVVAASSYS